VVVSSEDRKEFSELEGKQFKIYLGTITYEVSLANYMQFILGAADSNESRSFLHSTSEFQRRLNAIKAEYEGHVFFADKKDVLPSFFPEDIQSSARESLSNLAIRIDELQVVELEFIEGSVKGRIKIALLGTFLYLPVAADLVTIAGFDLMDFAHKEKDRIYDQGCISFDNLQNHGNGNVNVNVNVYVNPGKPTDMQTYLPEPERVVEDFAKGIMKELNIPRPQARPLRPKP
jgi:hypothetical protein